MVGGRAFALLIGLVDIFIAEQFAEDAWCKANIRTRDKAYDFLGLLWSSDQWGFRYCSRISFDRLSISQNGFSSKYGNGCTINYFLPAR
tara:strand:+ start:7118 stop:7384 length:267 start_codon:yes stop_codon:yes gene_type:complete